MPINNLNTTLKSPRKPSELSNKAQWLAGEGAGSWFEIEETDKELFFKISRYSPVGELECEGIFYQDHHPDRFDFHLSFSFTHISHCAEVSILQNNNLFKFVRFSDVESNP